MALVVPEPVETTTDPQPCTSPEDRPTASLIVLHFTLPIYSSRGGMSRLLLLCVLAGMVSATDECWWTGCQKNDWLVQGCEQYNRVQIAVRGCSNGHEFHCCPSTGAYTIQPGDTSADTCWWTGCQKNDWAVRGCEQYNRVQRSLRYCGNGEEYFCCPASGGGATSTSSGGSGSGETCWWTGCQRNDWAVRGCEQYNRVQSSIRNCGDGDEYYCCPSAGAYTGGNSIQPSAWNSGAPAGGTGSPGGQSGGSGTNYAGNAPSYSNGGGQPYSGGSGTYPAAGNAPSYGGSSPSSGSYSGGNAVGYSPSYSNGGGQPYSGGSGTPPAAGNAPTYAGSSPSSGSYSGGNSVGYAPSYSSGGGQPYSGGSGTPSVAGNAPSYPGSSSSSGTYSGGNSVGYAPNYSNGGGQQYSGGSGTSPVAGNAPSYGGSSPSSGSYTGGNAVGYSPSYSNGGGQPYSGGSGSSPVAGNPPSYAGSSPFSGSYSGGSPVGYSHSYSNGGQSYSGGTSPAIGYAPTYSSGGGSSPSGGISGGSGSPPAGGAGLCWWTGCQRDDWKVQGCEQYNMIQVNSQHCSTGQYYYCCPKTEGTNTQTVVPDSGDSCWWTGCQKNDWAVRGCANYNRVQDNVRYCDNGQEYHCCPQTSRGTPIPTESCWWTGCQKNDWKVRGCDNYNRTQVNVRYCDNGQEYYCCTRTSSTNQQTVVPDSGDSCWWTGCQKNDWKVRGCDNYNRVKNNVRSCHNGEEYYCCPKQNW